MNKSIELKLSEWVNWIAQDHSGLILETEHEPFHDDANLIFRFHSGESNLLRISVINKNWRESKINLKTDSCYIDECGILRKVESK